MSAQVDQPASATTTPDPAHFRELYGRLCTAYHAIDDFRSKLLSFLPLVSGLSIWGLVGKSNTIPDQYWPAIGFLGAFTVFALAIYETKGIQKCVAIIDAGAAIEKKLWPEVGEGAPGLFGRLSQGGPANKLVPEPFASALIYGVSFGAWVYVAFGFPIHESTGTITDMAMWLGIGAIVLVAGGMYAYWLFLPKGNGASPSG
jgi:hypothetical protein